MMWTIGGVLLLALIIFGMYNRLVGRRNAVENAFAGIDTMLKMRYDLIPNLVAAVKQYMQHEAGTLTKVTELRTKVVSGGLSSNEQVEVNNEIALNPAWTDGRGRKLPAIAGLGEFSTAAGVVE